MFREDAEIWRYILLIELQLILRKFFHVFWYSTLGYHYFGHGKNSQSAVLFIFNMQKLLENKAWSMVDIFPLRTSLHDSIQITKLET